MAAGVAQDNVGVVRGAASCVSVRVCPPIVMVPPRLDEDAFAWTSKGAVPLPEPPAVQSVTQDKEVVTAHSHPAPVETSTV